MRTLRQSGNAISLRMTLVVLVTLAWEKPWHKALNFIDLAPSVFYQSRVVAQGGNGAYARGDRGDHGGTWSKKGI